MWVLPFFIYFLFLTETVDTSSKWMAIKIEHKFDAVKESIFNENMEDHKCIDYPYHLKKKRKKEYVVVQPCFSYNMEPTRQGRK